MGMAFVAIVAGLLLLLWSADKFVDGSSAVARHFRMPPLLIGMVIVGFGTSAPEMTVSALAALEGSPNIALGNAYGSNITNIALILGLTALISPIIVDSQVLRKELPILTLITALAAWQLWDLKITRFDAIALLIVFSGLMAWTIWQGLKNKEDSLAGVVEAQLENHSASLRLSLMWLLVGLVFLIISSRMLVWGVLEVAHHFGVSDLILGLTVVAVGTSLPELASSVIAARKGEHDIALGNIIGSNLFNTLAVVGIAGAISPMQVGAEVFTRDMMVMLALTVSLFFIGFGFRTWGKGQGRINRFEGIGLLLCYFGYTGYLITTVL